MFSLDKDLKVIYGTWFFVVFSVFMVIQFIPLTSATLVLGTNCGFVTTAPTDDPAASTTTQDNWAWATKDTAPAGAVKITEIGWWCDTATEAANFEVGIYSHDSGNDKPDAVVGSLSQTNAKGTTAGWKTVTVDIAITENTIYWISVQLDDTATQTSLNYGSGGKWSRKRATTLTDPWGESHQGTDALGYYAVWEEAAPTDTCTYSGSEDWNISLSDSCIITDNTNLSESILYFYGTGNATINSTINVSDIKFQNADANSIVYMDSNARLIVG